MTKTATCLLAALCFFSFSYAQQPSLKGSVSDTSEKKTLYNTVVSVLRKSDSVLIAFTRTDKSGNFSFPKLPAGNELILVTHPAYADYVDEAQIEKEKTTDLGKIFMTLKSQLLQEVVVTNSGAIRIKGDTIEYKVDSMHMKAGATVEDMLKKLPGIQV